MSNRLLLRGGYVISVDPEIGDINGGDVLIEDDTIAAVAPSIDVSDAQVLDVTGDIVIPGFIDTHRHLWETSIRGCAPNATLDDYFGIVLDGFAVAYRPEDVYVANYMGALECINAGITTVLDWSHIQNTPDHSDEAVRGLRESSIRSVFAYGFPNTSLADWWFNSSLKTPDDVRRTFRRTTGS
jgi:5-methylthioadenosine/S-adenosylhomocysteine deaminase